MIWVHMYIISNDPSFVNLFSATVAMFVLISLRIPDLIFCLTWNGVCVAVGSCMIHDPVLFFFVLFFFFSR